MGALQLVAKGRLGGYDTAPIFNRCPLCLLTPAFAIHSSGPIPLFEKVFFHPAAGAKFVADPRIRQVKFQPGEQGALGPGYPG